jgi:serine/threonine-protein kinase PknK
MSDIDLGIPGITDVEEVASTSAYTTYRVRDAGSGQLAYVKVVRGTSRPPSVVQRFAAEQDVLKDLATHPNLVSVFGNGTTANGEQFVVTEVTPATTLADRIKTAPPVTGPEVLRLGIRASGALESVHRGGVVHGDLRATNIVLDDRGEPNVADVGLATLTGASVASAGDARELQHASPEQLDGQYLTPASDQYSLATALYHLLAGEAAFVRPGETSVVPVIKRIATEPAPDLKSKGVPPPVADVVHKALSKSPGERYPNMQSFARALQQAEVALGLPVTDLTVMTPSTQLPTVWESAPAAPSPPPAAAPIASGPPSGAPSAGPPPSTPAGPPASMPSTASTGSRRPLLIGIGIAVVIVLIAAVLLTRGGGSKKNASSSTTGITTTTAKRRASTTTTTSAGSSFTDFAPAGFHTITESFDHGTVEAFVPNDWNDDFPVQLDNGEPQLRIAPDATAFVDGTFTHPGVQIDAFSQVDTKDPDALLAVFGSLPPDKTGWPGGPPNDVCTPAGKGNYPADLGTTSDGSFIGKFERFTNCRGAGSLLVIVALPSDQSFIVDIVVQTVTPADEQAVPTIVGSVLVDNFP